MLSLGGGAVVLTHGERAAGSALVCRRQFVPAFGVEAVEPTGAGDAFLRRRRAVAQAERMGSSLRRRYAVYAAAAGAADATTPGAWDGCQTERDSTRFLLVV